MFKNINIYKRDLKEKGIYWSVIHRFYKIPMAKPFFQPIINILKPSFIKIGKDKLYIDKDDQVVSQELIQSGKWEPFETKIFKKSIKKGDVVLDIGAHIGYYTLIAAKIVGDKGKVYAFEPDPKNFSLLKKNIEENNYKNVVPINKAVSNNNGKIKLYINPANTGDHRIFKSADKRGGIITETITLDDYFKNDIKIDFIKIDIQGAEHTALLGAKNILRYNKNLKIITEVEPLLLRNAGSSTRMYLNFLEKNYFSLYEINERSKLTMKTLSKKLLVLPENPFVKVNLLCKKTR